MPALIRTEFVNPKPINLGIRKELGSPILFLGVSVCGLVLVRIKGLINTPQQNILCVWAQKHRSRILIRQNGVIRGRFKKERNKLTKARKMRKLGTLSLKKKVWAG